MGESAGLDDARAGAGDFGCVGAVPVAEALAVARRLAECRILFMNEGTSPHRALDTSADADAVQLDIYRRLGGPGRVAIAFRLNASVRAVTAAGIRSRHPTYDERQVRLAATRLSIGDDLMRRAFPGHELVDP